MAHNFQRPPEPEDFATYLQRLLDPKGKGRYSVTYRPDQGATGGYYNIVGRQGGQSLSTNLRINLQTASPFETDYGQGPSAEFAPEVLTRRGDRGFMLSGMWQSRYKFNPKATGGAPKFGVEHLLASPTENLANAIREGFMQTYDDIRMGVQNVRVKSKIYNILAEGSGETAAYNVPAGSLLVKRGPEWEGIRRSAARSLVLKNLIDPTDKVNPFEQRRALAQARLNMLETETPIPFWNKKRPALTNISQLFKRMGFGIDRDNENRMVAYAQGARNVIDEMNRNVTEIYLPTPKIAKHGTIARTGREFATLLGQDLKPIQAQGITGRGPDFTGFRRTTAAMGGRIPEQSLVLGTMFSPQYPVPGSAMYFPESTGLDVRYGGYETTPSFALTQNVGALVSGTMGLKLPVKTGDVLPSMQKYTYAKLAQPGAEKAVDLQRRLGAHSFSVSGQQLRIPKYYSTAEGIGAAYDPELLATGSYNEVTQAQVEALSKRIGVPVQIDETVSRAYLELQGYSLIGGKMAAGGWKAGLDEYSGSPQVNIMQPSVLPSGKTGPLEPTGQQLPISALTMESKVFPESFMQAIGAMSPHQQRRLLADYSRSLGQSTDPISQQMRRGLHSAMRAVNVARRTNPNARLDLDDLAARMSAGLENEVPALEIGKDIFRRLFVPPGTDETKLEGMTEERLMGFAESSYNMRNLSRYGMGWVSPRMTSPVEGFVSEENYRMGLASWQNYAINKLGIAPENVEAEYRRQYGFGDLNADTNQRVRMFNPSGFYMPSIAGPAVEFSGAGLLGSEEVMLLNQLSPEFARNVGVSLQDLKTAGGLSRNIRNPVRKAQAQIAQTMMAEASRGEVAIHIPEALKIDEDIALRMSTDPEIQELLAMKDANLGQIPAFGEALKRYFPNVVNPAGQAVEYAAAPNMYLPPSQAIGMLATEDVPTMGEEEFTGEDVTRTWDVYRRAFYEGIMGQAMNDPGRITSQTGNLFRRFSEMFGLPEGNKRDAVKAMLASDVGRTTARYAYNPELKQNEIYASRETLEHAIRSELVAQGIEPTEGDVRQVYRMISGTETDPRVSQTPEYVRSQGVPSAFWRYPNVTGERGMLGVNVLTPEHMERLGRTVPGHRSGLNKLVFQIGSGLSSIMQGDFDWDIASLFMGIQAKRDATGKPIRDKSGQMQFTLGSFNKENEVDPALRENIEWTGQASNEMLQAEFFQSPVQRKKFDPLYGSFADRGPGGLRGVAAMMRGQMENAGYYTLSQLATSLQHYSGAKGQMADAYNYTRAIQGIASIAGWSEEAQQKALQSRASLYQPYLDFSTGMPYGILQMYKTAALTQNTQGKVGMTWGLPRRGIMDEMKFLRGGSESVELHPEKAIGTLTALAQSAVQPMLYPSGEAELPTPAVLASAFAPEGERAFRPKRTAEEAEALNKQYSQARKDVRLGVAGGQENLNDWYRQVSLEEALLKPYRRYSDSIATRGSGMASAIVGWARANYNLDSEDAAERIAGGTKVLQANLPQVMFSKAHRSKLRRDPDFELSSRFLQNPLGQGLLKRSKMFNPLFTMLKGGLPTGSEAMRFARLTEKIRTPVVNWARGNIQNLMGFRSARMQPEFGSLYHQTMAQTINLRASHLGGLSSADPNVQKRTGQAATEMMVSKMLGIPGGQTYQFTNALNPRMPDVQKRLDYGKYLEEQLGKAMVDRGDQGWYAFRRDRLSPDATTEYQGAFIWEGQAAGKNVSVASTPDFTQVYTDPETGEKRMRFIEQKSPGPRTKAANILSKITGGEWGQQARSTSWIVDKLRQDMLGGDTAAAERAETSLDASLASLGINKDTRQELIRNIRAGSLPEAMPFVTQKGTALAENIELGRKADPGLISAQLLKQADEGQLYQPMPGDATLTGISASVERASQFMQNYLPFGLVKTWQKVQSAPARWQQVQDALRSSGQTPYPAVQALDFLRKSWDRMRAIGSTAQQEIDAQAAAQQPPPPNQAPTRQGPIPTTGVTAEQLVGPKFRQYIEKLESLETAKAGTRPYAQGELENFVKQEEERIRQAARTGTPQEYDIKKTPGVPSEMVAQAMGELAKKQGLTSHFQMYSDKGGFRATYQKAHGNRKTGFVTSETIQAPTPSAHQQTAQQATIPTPAVDQEEVAPGGQVPPVVPPADTTGGATTPSGTPIPGGQTGMPDPSALAGTFVQDYNAYMGLVRRGAGGVRAEIERLTGVQVQPGYVAAALQKFPSELMPHVFGQFEEATIRAQQLSKQAGQLARTNPADVASSVPSNWQALYSGLRTTGTPEGKDLQDLLTLFKHRETADKLGGRKLGVGEDLVSFQKELIESTQQLTKTFKDLNTTGVGWNEDMEKAVREGKLSQATAQAGVNMALAAGKLPKSFLTPTEYPMPGGGLFRSYDLGGKLAAGDIDKLSRTQQKNLAAFQKAQVAYEQAVTTEQLGKMAPAGGAGGKSIAGMLRRTLGGFGMMYIRNLLNFATQGLDYGYQERTALDMGIAQTTGAMTGIATTPYNQQQMIANRRALMGTNYNALQALANTFQGTPGLSDVYNAGTAGLGGYAMATWIGSMAPEGNLMAKYPAQIGMGLAGLSFLANSFQKSQDIEGLGWRNAGTSTLGLITRPSDLVASALTAYRGEADDLTRITNTYKMLQTNLGIGGLGWDELVRPQTTLAKKRAGQGYFVDYGTDEGRAWYESALQRQMISEYSQYSPEIHQQAYTFMRAAGVSPDEYGNVISRMATTQWLPQNASAVLTAAGYSSYQQYQGGMLSNFYMNNQVGLLQGQQMQAGAEMLSQMGMGGYYIAQGMTIPQLTNYTTQLGQVAGTPAAQTYMNQVQLWQKQQQLGWGTTTPIAPTPLTPQPTQDELGIAELRNAVAMGKVQQAEQAQQLLARYLGVPVEEARGYTQKYEWWPEQRSQADVARLGRVATMVSRERELMPEMAEQYYTNYGEMLRGLGLEDLTARETRQTSELGLKQYMAQYGLADVFAGMQQDFRGRSTAEQQWLIDQIQGGVTIGQGLAGAFQLPQAQRQQLIDYNVRRGMAGQATVYQQGVYQGMANFDPMALTRYYAGMVPQQPGIEPQSWMAQREILPSQFGQLQGIPVNAENFALSGLENANFGRLTEIIGLDWMKQFAGTDLGNAFINGFQMPGTNMNMGGMMGVSMYMQSLQRKYAGAGAGIAAEQLALQREYVPQFWAIQDQQRALNRQQQQWSFGFQLGGLQVQERQFAEQTALQQQQMSMQRQWTREDWAFNEENRAMQWGWKVEDFQENLRFMTGRDRRLAERQMERETIMYDREGEQMDRQKARQEELWQLEDERFDMQQRHFKEGIERQEEAIRKQQEFFEKRMKLEDELIALQREYQEKQWELQEKSIGMQTAMLEEQQKIQDLQNAINILALENQGLLELNEAESKTINQYVSAAVQAFIDGMKRAKGVADGIGGGGGGGTSGTSSTLPDMTAGGTVGWQTVPGAPGVPYDVTLHGGEAYNVMKPGELASYDPWQSEQLGEMPRVASTPAPTTIIVQIGNEEIKRYVIDAVVQGL